MTVFEETFPDYVKATADLHALLVPWGMAILVIAFAVEFWSGPPSAGDMIKFLVKIFLIVLLVSQAYGLITDAQKAVQTLVEKNVPARPANVATRYQEKLAAAQDAESQNSKGFWTTLFSSNWFEAIIYAVLTLISWLAMAVVFLIYNLQRVLLLGCWCLSPLFCPLLAIRPLSSMGMNFILRILGILIWPLGLALAATFTDGLLGVAAQQDLLANSTAVGTLGSGLQTLLAVAVVAIWILYSSVLAPVYIQKLVTGSAGPASLVTKGAESAVNLAAAVSFGIPAVMFGLSMSTRLAAFAGAKVMSRMRRAPAEDKPPGSQGGTSSSSGSSWKPDASDPTGDEHIEAMMKRLRPS